MPKEEHGGGVNEPSDDAEAARVVSNLRVVQELLGSERRCHNGKCRPVLRGQIESVIGGNHAAGAGHVAGNNRRVSRQVLAEMARNQPTVRVVSSADPDRDSQVECPALIEQILGLGAMETKDENAKGTRKTKSKSTHHQPSRTFRPLGSAIDRPFGRNMHLVRLDGRLTGNIAAPQVLLDQLGGALIRRPVSATAPGLDSY